MKHLFYKTLIIIFICAFSVLSQYAPPIHYYSHDLYRAGNQNWKIDQDEYGRIFAANNFGLLEFNGTNWKLHPTPNKTIMRSVLVTTKAVYTGSYMDFGFWSRQQDGQLTYTSLAGSHHFEMIEDEQFWNILSHKQFILFQSLDRLVIYDQLKNSLRVFNPVSGIIKAFVDSENIYYQDNNLSLYKIENEKSQVYINAKTLNQNHVVGISSTPNGDVIVTRDNGLFLFSENLTPFAASIKLDLSRDVVYSYSKTQSGNLILGTVKNGIYVLSSKGELIYHLNTDDGLNNNTVLSVFPDLNNGLWLGLDDGLAYVSLESPIQQYSLNNGTIGTVYTTQIFDNKLYVGTNQGLYYKNNNATDPLKPIKGLEGQVWSLQVIDQKLICGHDKGAFIVAESVVKPLHSKIGFWLFKKINDSKMLGGAYDGLHLFEKRANGWEHKNHIDNFSISSRYFELVNDHEVLMSHEYKGVYNILIDRDYVKADVVGQLPNMPVSLYSSLVMLQKDICYFSMQGFFVYDRESKRFVKNTPISNLFDENNFTSAKMTVDRNKYLWLFERNNLIRIEKAALTNDFIFNKFPLLFETRKTNTGFENISHLNQDSYLMGTSNGFLVYDTSKIRLHSPKLMLSNVTASSKNKEQHIQNLQDDDISLPAQFNNITASYFLSNNHVGDKVLFSYKLEGYSENWSDWSENASIAFNNLKFGTYALYARAMVGDVISDNMLEFSFKIQRPWYFSTVALIGYALFMFGLFVFINKRYTNYYHQEQEKLIRENKRKLNLMELKKNEEIMRIKNEQLQDNIEQKNKELAISTMAMVKKNQFMNALLNDLEPASSHPTVSRVIRIINRSLKNDDDWEFFEQAFNNADKDFLNQLKEKHDSLTNHDLKLCAYLRLNLSSKEIAPLLNISVKSVDIKRYRLRKKMNLDHDQNLTDYILSL